MLGLPCIGLWLQLHCKLNYSSHTTIITAILQWPKLEWFLKKRHTFDRSGLLANMLRIYPPIGICSITEAFLCLPHPSTNLPGIHSKTTARDTLYWSRPTAWGTLYCSRTTAGAPCTSLMLQLVTPWTALKLQTGTLYIAVLIKDCRLVHPLLL